MHENPLKTFLALRASIQQTLIQFLNTDLDLALTFLGMAKIETGRTAENRKVSFRNAQVALRSIQRFKDCIEDLGERQKISDRADELEAAISVDVLLRHPIPEPRTHHGRFSSFE